MAIFGYVRVARKDPDSIGVLSHESEILQKYKTDKMCIDEGFSAFDFKPGLQKMMDQAVKGDTIIVTRLDNISKNPEHIRDFLLELEGKGIRLIITERNYDTNQHGYKGLIYPTPFGKDVLSFIRNSVYGSKRVSKRKRNSSGI